jgi:hypothetical protein
MVKAEMILPKGQAGTSNLVGVGPCVASTYALDNRNQLGKRILASNSYRLTVERIRTSRLDCKTSQTQRVPI